MTPIEELKEDLKDRSNSLARKSLDALAFTSTRESEWFRKASIETLAQLAAVESLEADNARLREALANITRLFQPSQSMREVDAVRRAAEALKEGGEK